MDIMWLALLGLLIGGWFILDGFGIGAALVTPWVAADTTERRRVLTAYGPFLLANEMWLIAAAGLLAGAFGTLEAPILNGLYPAIVALLAGWMLRDAAMWLRSRRPGTTWRRVWDRILVAAGVIFAMSVGVLLGNVTQGLPTGGMVPATTVFGPFPLLCGVTMVVLFALHGAVFLRLRLPDPMAARAARTAGRLTVPAAVLTVLTAVLGVAVAGLSAAGLLVVLTPIAALAARTRLARRPGQAFACTAVAVGTPVLAVGAGLAGPLLDAAYDAPQLTLIIPPVLAVVLAYQAWLWWLFRKPLSGRLAAFF